MRARPVVHFVLIGAVLFALERGIGSSDAPTAVPRAGAAPMARRPPGDAMAADEDLLYRAALARGLDRDDPVVQARLMHNMRFLTGEAGGAELYRDARALGLADGDLVVRRRLIDRMRRLLQAKALDDEPGEAALQAYLEAHADRFALPARVRLTQVFFSRQRRGAAAATDALRQLSQLGPVDVARAPALGDPLPVRRDLPFASVRDLARIFGPRLAAAAVNLPPDRWHGPLESAYGVHLVWVHEREPARVPALALVRAEVRAALREARAAAALRESLSALRAGAGGGAE